MTRRREIREFEARVKERIDRIEKKQEKKLEERRKLREEQITKKLEDAMVAKAVTIAAPATDHVNAMKSSFEDKVCPTINLTRMMCCDVLYYPFFSTRLPRRRLRSIGSRCWLTWLRLKGRSER